MSPFTGTILLMQSRSVRLGLVVQQDHQEVRDDLEQEDRRVTKVSLDKITLESPVLLVLKGNLVEMARFVLPVWDHRQL